MRPSVVRSFVACAAIALASVVTLSPRHARAEDAPTTAPVEPVDFRKVKDAMPKTLAGLAREDATGQRMKMGDTAFTTVEASYGKDEKTVKVTTMDYGNPDMAKGMSMSFAAEIDQESDKEYTKTADVQGRRALLTYNTEEKRGTVQTLAGGRIVVSIESHGLTDDEFKKLADEVPLKALDALVTGK